MEHSDHLTMIMEHYDDALEELMGAQKYAKIAERCKDKDRKHRYHTMAMQELEHEKNIEADAESVVSEARHDMMTAVWDHLKKHLHSWRKDIETELESMK